MAALTEVRDNNMKVLLINPPDANTISEAVSDDGSTYIEPSDFGAFPPLGLLYVAASLEQHNKNNKVVLVDCVAENISYEMLKDKINKIQPDAVGITSFTVSLIDVVKTATLVRKVCPMAHITMGGHHPIAFPFESIALEEIDTIVVGEGEEVYPQLIDAIKNGDDYTGIIGVYTFKSIQKYKKISVSDKRFLHNLMVPAAYVDDLDSLPFPSRKHISHIQFHSTVGTSGNLATLISSRGSPYKCTFCDVPYKKYRSRSVELVVDEIEECLRLGYDEFHFYDDLFNIKASKIHGFCDELEKRKLKINWDFRGRVNAVTKDTLVHAKKVGLRQISFGVETGTDEGLKALKKGSKTHKYIETFKWTRELGIKTVADFIIGFPFEKNEEDIRKNIDYLISLDPDYVIIGVLMLLPGTELYEQGVAKGQVDPEKWVNFCLKPNETFQLDYWTEYMTANQLMQLRIDSYKRFYMRPKYIIRTVFSVRSYAQFKSLAYGFL